MANRSMATGSQDLARLRHRFQGRVLLPDEDGYHYCTTLSVWRSHTWSVWEGRLVGSR
jgi:hypothetical protein